MKYKHIIILFAALALLAVAIFSLSDDLLSPYVSFEEAMDESGKTVQIIGRLDRSIPVQHREGEFSFSLLDKKNTVIKVIHRGLKPMNFEESEEVVVLGRYDGQSQSFIAEKVLVKCPSKYRRKIK